MLKKLRNKTIRQLTETIAHDYIKLCEYQEQIADLRLELARANIKLAKSIADEHLAKQGPRPASIEVRYTDGTVRHNLNIY